MTAPPLIWGMIELSGTYAVPFGIVIAGNLIGGAALLGMFLLCDPDDIDADHPNGAPHCM